MYASAIIIINMNKVPPLTSRTRVAAINILYRFNRQLPPQINNFFDDGKVMVQACHLSDDTAPWQGAIKNRLYANNAYLIRNVLLDGCIPGAHASVVSPRKVNHRDESAGTPLGARICVGMPRFHAERKSGGEGSRAAVFLKRSRW